MSKSEENKSGVKSYSDLSIMDKVREAASAKTSDDMPVEACLKIMRDWDYHLNHRPL
jgi:hypothetical protein